MGFDITTTYLQNSENGTMRLFHDQPFEALKNLTVKDLVNKMDNLIAAQDAADREATVLALDPEYIRNYRSIPETDWIYQRALKANSTGKVNLTEFLNLLPVDDMQYENTTLFSGQYHNSTDYASSRDGRFDDDRGSENEYYPDDYVLTDYYSNDQDNYEGDRLPTRSDYDRSQRPQNISYLWGRNRN